MTHNTNHVVERLLLSPYGHKIWEDDGLVHITLISETERVTISDANWNIAVTKALDEMDRRMR